MRKPLLAIGACLPLMLASCYSITHDYDGPREITPGTTLTQPSEAVGKVAGSKNATFLFWGIIPLNESSAPELANSLATGSLGEHDGITRLTIHEEQDVVDVIVTGLTLGIFSMVTVETEGEVHRYAGGSQ